MADLTALASPWHSNGDRRWLFLVGCGLPALLLAAAAGVLPIGWPSAGALVLLALPAGALALRQGVAHVRISSGLEAARLADRVAAVILDNQRLTAEASMATREVQQSRTRIVASVERERRRIERDLHDGAQQRLVAIRIELELAEELVRSDPRRGIERLKELERAVDEALDELRSLAHGVCPPLLADRGIVEALQSAARRSPISVSVEAYQVGRYAPEVEGAVYFCVVEALQNVLKHAEAHGVEVHLDGSRRPALRFSVRDDGVGMPDGATARGGAGITNIRDRLAAVGGGLDITSTVGVGTTVRGNVATGPFAPTADQSVGRP
jgi:signal transduction histidine kinase